MRFAWFDWPWEDHDDILPDDDHTDRALRHIARELATIIRLLQPDPATVTIISEGAATMANITLAPGETRQYTYVEADAEGLFILPLVGTPAWSTPDPAIATVADNGDNTATLTGVNGGATSLDLTVTYPSGNTGSDSDPVSVAIPVPDPASVTIQPA